MHGSIENRLHDWTAERQTSQEATRMWLEAYYAKASGDLIFARPKGRFWKRRSTASLKDCSLDELARAVHGQSQLYLKINTMDSDQIIARGRFGVGKNSEIVELVSFHADIDCDKRPGYPTRAFAIKRLRSLGFAPSMIVGSGGPNFGGLHVSWLLDLPLLVGNQLDELRALSKRFQKFIADAIHPYETDKLSNLERVLRVVGSVRTDGERVALLELNDRRYSIDDIKNACPGHSPQQRSKQQKRTYSETAAPSDSTRIITEYLAATGTRFEDLLESYGWKHVGEDNGQNLWQRPNAPADAAPVSARQGVGQNGKPGIWNFSGNAGLAADTWHGIEAIFVYYRFAGDWKKAASFCYEQLSKTAAATQLIASGAWGPTTFCCASHANCVEIHHTLSSLGISVGLYPTVSDENCINAANAKKAMQIGLPIVSTVCANCPNTITTSDNQSLCRYHRQRVHAECETTRIGTHARLVYSDIAGDSETVVIDEDALPTIRKFVSLDKQDIQSALSWWQASGLPQGEACAIVCDNLLAAIDNGGASHEPVLLPPLAFKSNGWHQAVWEDKSAPQESATAIMKLTAGDYAEVGACSSNVVIVFGSNSFHNKRIVYLDTTANQELLTRALFRQTVAGVDLTAMSGACQPMKDLTPTGSVAIAQRPIQIPELDITIGSDHDAKAKRLARYIVALIAKHDYQRISVIGHSKHTDAIKKYVPSEFHWRLLDFFYFRQGGSNYWHNMRCDCLIVAGTPRVPTEAVRDQLAAFGYWGVTIPDMVSCQVHIDGQTFVSRKYASADVQMVYEYLVNAPLLQAIGRSRPLQSEVRCDTYILSNAIIPSWYPRIEPPGVLNEITDRTVDVSQAVARLSKDGKDVSTTAIATHLAMGARYVREVLQVARNLNLVIQVGERSGYLPSAVWQRNSHPSISG